MSFTSEELLALYEVHAPTVFRRARQLIGHEPDAWDVVHDTFLALLEQGRRFRTETRPTSYLIGITTHLCLRRLRDGRMQSKAQAWLLRGAEGSVAPSEHAAVARDFLLHLAHALGSNERAMEIAVYKYLDGMTQEQIAETMGISRKTVQRDLDMVWTLAGNLAIEHAGSLT